RRRAKCYGEAIFGRTGSAVVARSHLTCNPNPYNRQWEPLRPGACRACQFETNPRSDDMRSDCLSRRTFLAGAASVATAAALPVAAQSAAGERKFELCAFEKFIQDLSYDELADVLAEMGFQGVEATVRRGGHIEAKNVEDELPKMHEALTKRGLAI